MANLNETNEIKSENTEKKTFPVSTFILSNIVCLLPILLGVILYDKLPADIPQQYGWNEQVNWTLPKPWGFIVSPLIILAANIVLFLSFYYTKQNLSKKVKALCFWIMPMVGLPVNSILILKPAGMNIDVFTSIALVIGLLFVILGNYLPKVEQNGFVGVRASWTRNNKDVWQKSQRISGILMVICGFILLVSSFLPFGKWIFIITIVFFALFSLISSLIIAAKEKTNKN